MTFSSLCSFYLQMSLQDKGYIFVAMGLTKKRSYRTDNGSSVEIWQFGKFCGDVHKKSRSFVSKLVSTNETIWFRFTYFSFIKCLGLAMYRKGLTKGRSTRLVCYSKATKVGHVQPIYLSIYLSRYSVTKLLY